MRNLTLVLPTAALLVLSACAGVDSTTGERTLTGTAVGAAGGAAAGLLTGDLVESALTGAAAGAAGGFVYDQIARGRD
jgi:osmotically inducible lipoprotein OsmB